MGRVRSLWLPVGLLSLALFAVVQLRLLPFGLALRIWLVGIGAMATSAIVASALASYPRTRVTPIWSRRAPPTPPERPAGLAEWERAVDFAAWNQTDFQRRLRPMLRRLAADRLRDRRGVDIDRDPDTSRALLGESAWAVYGESGKTGKAGPPGLGTEAIREALASLEEL